MPRGDGTGPVGAGPMSGRAAGFCAGFHTPGFANPVSRQMGMGDGRGRGFGRRSHVWPNVMSMTAPEDESTVLRNQAAVLKQQLEAVEKRLEALKEQ